MQESLISELAIALKGMATVAKAASNEAIHQQGWAPDTNFAFEEALIRQREIILWELHEARNPAMLSEKETDLHEALSKDRKKEMTGATLMYRPGDLYNH